MNATATQIPVAPIVRRVDFDALLAGDPKMTAAGSRYSAEIWDLGVEMQALRKLPSERQLDFRMRASSSAKYLFPEGKVLADYPAFHRHAKRLMAAMTLCPRNTRRPVYAAQSLILTLRGLRRIYCHFAREGYWSLETVPQSAFEAYVQDVSSFSCSFVSTFRSIHIYRDLVPAFTFDCWRIMLKSPRAR